MSIWERGKPFLSGPLLWGISYSTLCKRVEKYELSIEEALKIPKGREYRVNNRIIEYDGRSLTIKQWERELGVSHHCIAGRLDERGWSLADALTTPPVKAKTIEFNGEIKTIREWSEILNVNYTTVWKRLKDGWSTEKALTTSSTMSNYIEYNGKRQTVKEWSEELGIDYGTLTNRITTLGWTIERAFKTTVRKTSPRKTETYNFQGKDLTLVQWAKELGVLRETLLRRLESGWDISDAFTIPVGQKRKCIPDEE